MKHSTCGTSVLRFIVFLVLDTNFNNTEHIPHIVKYNICLLKKCYNQQTKNKQNEHKTFVIHPLRFEYKN